MIHQIISGGEISSETLTDGARNNKYSKTAKQGKQVINRRTRRDANVPFRAR